MSPLNRFPNELSERLKRDRHWLHAHPEVAYEEHETAAFISRRLEALGVQHETGMAKTGIVAEIRGTGDSNRAIGFRADMDALAMQEESNLSYRSVTDGKMHGCGHDGHTTILLGLAEVLSLDRSFDGTVRLIFQPAEEGFAGARKMVEEGLFDRFPMQRIYALHNWPDLPPGTIGTQSGPIMASSHFLGITLRGKGGHGATPHQATPLMTVAAHVQLALNSYIAQQINTQRAVVISITRIIAGEAIAVLPSNVRIEGACRLLDAYTISQFYRDVPQLIEAIAAAFGATAEVELIEKYPTTQNDSAAVDIVRQAVKALGLAHVCETTNQDPSMASEDFSFMLKPALEPISGWGRVVAKTEALCINQLTTSMTM